MTWDRKLPMIAYLPVGLTPETSPETVLERLNPDFRRVLAPCEASDARLLVLDCALPFEAGAAWLKAKGWWRDLPGLVSAGVLLVGLEGAMHLLAEGSEEAPRLTGLGLLPGVARRLGPRVKVPHLGWSRVQAVSVHPAFPDPKNAWLYHAHTHALETDSATVWQARHGRSFSVVTCRGRVAGIQPRLGCSGALGAVVLQGLRGWAGLDRTEDPCRRNV